VRRQLIRQVLPILFCTVPPLAGALIAVSLPADAQRFYLRNMSPLDRLIVALGAVLFVLQTMLAWRALQWNGTGFNQGPDRWLSNLAQAAEWFPLLGLIGTVASIMQTFAAFGNTKEIVTQKEIIFKYAPAITATCSGLFMALINILPTWVVLMGRDLIRALGGEMPQPEPSAPVAEVYSAPLADSKSRSRSGSGSSSGSGTART